MARYFIHVDDNGSEQIDPSGAEFRTEAIAVGEAARLAGELACEGVRANASSQRIRITVADADGTTTATIVLELTMSR